MNIVARDLFYDLITDNAVLNRKVYYLA